MKVKRLLALIIAIVMLLGVLPFAQLSVSAASYENLRKGDKGESVKTLQTMLNEVNNAGLAVDGSFGGGTRTAVNNFQKANGLKVDGVAGSATWSALASKYYKLYPEKLKFPGTLKKGNKTSDVKTLQILLNELMNAGLDVDGSFGGASYKKVVSYQKSVGLKDDGIVNKATWDELVNEYTNVGSRLKIGEGTYNPGTLLKGSSYSISGVITSNYKITSVTVGVYKTDGTATTVVKTVAPNAKSYDIDKVDKYIKFGTLAIGTYKFVVKAKDASGTTRTLVNNEFSVKKTKVETFEEYVLANWESPLKRTDFYKIPGTIRRFGANRRTGNRLHAAIDFTFRNGKGIPVYAMESGKVVEYVSNFYGGMNSVAIQHPDGSVARYCEVKTSLRKGDTVKKGQQVATIAKSNIGGSTMLHLELYLGTSTGKFTNRTNTTYKYVSGTRYNRRSDLVDPTFLMELVNSRN